MAMLNNQRVPFESHEIPHENPKHHGGPKGPRTHAVQLGRSASAKGPKVPSKLRGGVCSLELS